MINHQLVQACNADIAIVKSWFNDDKELEQWGGPGLTLDVSLDEFAAQIKLGELSSFCLKDGEGNPCGIGQFYVRLGRHHFGRIAISPACRGQGLAYILMNLLAQQAPKHQQAQGFSLFVLEHNVPAIKTYQRLGFEFASYPDDIPGGFTGSFPGCLYMVTDVLKLDSSKGR